MKIKTELVRVAFHGAPLYLVAHDGEPYVPMRPVVEGMGLAWAPQHAKLTADKDRWGVMIIVTPSEGGPQESLCLPLRKILGWLMTLSPNKVKPTLRERIIRYQRECDDVLWRHWTRQADIVTGQGIGPFLDLTRARLGHSVASLNAAILLEWLMVNCADGASYAFSLRELARETRVSKTGVSRVLEALESWGFIRREKDHSGMTGRIRLLVGRLRQALGKPQRQAALH